MRRWSSFVPGGYAGNLRRELTVDNLTSAGGGGADGAVHSAHKAAVGNIAHLRSGTITDEACTTFISLTLDTFGIAIDAVSGGEGEQRGREDGMKDHVEGFPSLDGKHGDLEMGGLCAATCEGERRGETWRRVRNGRDGGGELKAGGGGGRHDDNIIARGRGMMVAMIVEARHCQRTKERTRPLFNGTVDRARPIVDSCRLSPVEHVDSPTTDADQADTELHAYSN
ncbi:hypothetical protein FGB62_95g086 [Gracilaria domingensis]|nr:hypothetical protein FGB62_95g086 [Gracilaria domingensis]